MLSDITSANLIALALTSAYVLVLYISPRDRPDGSYLTNRNNPLVIKRKMAKVTAITCIEVLGVITMLLRNHGLSEALHIMGIVPGKDGVTSFFYRLFSFAVLFAGPILNDTLIDGENLFKLFLQEIQTVQGFRNYVFAPITEELVYTCCCLSLYHQVRTVDPDVVPSLVYWTPIFFAAAHFHHGIELYLTRTQSLPQILASLIFQFAYTWFFGILTNKIFVKDISIWSCIGCHVFCNFMGFPDLVPSRGDLLGGSWKYIYPGLLIAGIYYFAQLMG